VAESVDVESSVAGRLHQVELLAADPELASELSHTVVCAARGALLTHELRLPAGPWDPADPAVAGLSPVGALLVEGYLMCETELAGRITSQLFGCDDLLWPWRQRAGTAAQTGWLALTASRLVLIEFELLEALREWPSITAALLDRCAAQFERATRQLAISQQARIETRLLAMLWHLARRWGRVAPEGVVLPMPLTHDVLGRLVGARRPTVSLAVKWLSETGSLSRRSDGTWLVSADSVGESELPIPRRRSSHARRGSWRLPERSVPREPGLPQPFAVRRDNRQLGDARSLTKDLVTTTEGTVL
jgi:hypothetical protein